MKALVVSLNFNPGHFSHLVANYKLFDEAGVETYLYVDQAFNEMDKGNSFRKINNLTAVDKKVSIDFAVFWFPSLKNILAIIQLKLRFKTKIIYVLHEPYDSFANYRRGGFSLGHVARICVVSLVNLLLVAMADRIILPSKKAHALYVKKYSSLNNNYFLIPLLFDDECPSEPDISKKINISYIGTIGADHAFAEFVNFIETSVREGWFPESQFLIATRSTIPPPLKQLLHKLPRERLHIVEGRPLSNEEINGYFRDSCVVWNAYDRSMQSGVLAKAYMFGTPVLVLARNTNEYVVDHETAILLDNNGDPSQIQRAIVEVRTNLLDYCRNCRRKFLECFYYKSNIAEFRRALGLPRH
jgi:glycosyltransferase involved in cell wall biosynthesis